MMRSQSFLLLASDAGVRDNFGISVAADGPYTLVGSPFDDDAGGSSITNSGSVYLFDAITGQELDKFVALDDEARDEFGFSVALDGDTALIGARKDQDNGTDSGSAYLFDVVAGQQMAKLLPSDGAANDLFGLSVSIDGPSAVVGAPCDDDNGTDSGSVYVFDSSTGVQLRKLLPSDGQASDEFGESVGVSGSVAIIGARLDDDNGNVAGSIYLFDVSTGQELSKIFPSDRAAGDQFGCEVAIDGTLAVVGSMKGTAGAVYTFDVSTGQQIAKFGPVNGNLFDCFGCAVAIDGTTIIVGASGRDDVGTNSGAAYVFDLTSGALLAQFLPNPDNSISFGYAVGISGQVTIASAPFSNELGTFSGSGSAYLNILVPADVVLRNGSGQNAIILDSVSDPVLGADWEFDLDCTGHAPSIAALEIYPLPFGGFFLSGGELLVDVSSGVLARALLPHSGGIVRFSVPIPDDVSLCGLQSSAQGAALGAPAYELSNALDGTIGF